MNQKFKRIPNQNLHERATNVLKEAILSGKFRPGQGLPSESELCIQLGVSRTVVREAMRSLQARGFLEIRRGSKGGAFVLELNQTVICNNLSDVIRSRKVTIDHLAQARLYLEPEISRLAAINATETDIERLKSAVKDYEMAKDEEQIITLNTLFHLCVGKACSNPFYSILLDVIMGLTEQLVRTIKPLSHIIHRQGEHKEILQAISQHDPYLAVEITIRHIQHINNEMKKLEEKYLEMNIDELNRIYGKGNARVMSQPSFAI